ncbi:hypothetical protein GW934_02415 [Candidatus Falkowbacteria bacterium]|nr:hypothetical protein [Candidatus Falkowbacteria bacterium]
MFEKFTFSFKQIENYYRAASRDFNMLRKGKYEPEIIFFFSYNVVIKISIAVCAKKGLRIKSKTGHHIALISKLGEILNDEEIVAMAGRMRMKRNKDLYSGGLSISQKEADFYFNFCKDLLKKAEGFLFQNKLF